MTAFDEMFSTDPQSRHLTPAHFRAGQWECPSCESANGEDDDLCWNCGATREGEKPEMEDE